MGISEDDVDNVQETNDENDGNNFVDREIQRQAFELNLKNIDRAGISNDGVLWIYSGVGGIGKTLLLDELKKLTKVHGKKFVRYDFKDGNNMVGTLKTLCKNLSTEYRMEFPLFDKACIYLAQKSGEFVSAEQQKAVLASSSTLRSLKKNFSKAFSLQDKSSTAIKAGKSVIDEDIFVEGLHTLGEGVQTVAEGITEITPIFKLGKGLLELLDKKIAEREEKKRLKTAEDKGNTDYGKIAAELEKLNAEDDPTRIREFLPTLFAQDLSFWLDENNTNLIVFFDTYELLTGEERDAKKTVRLSSGDAPVDWWVGKLLAADRVMWVIAGRYEPEKIGRVTLSKDGVRKNFVKSYIVDVFNENWSNKYLQLLGVAEENLRGEIFKLTGGHPFYLHQCSITYNNERAKGKRPSIKDFGKNRDEIIERAVGSFDANGQYLTQCLCILNRWTDEVAVAVIPNFNNVTYRRIVKLFARADSFDFDDETVYIFDRTIDAFFFPSLKVDVTCSRLFTDIRDAANKFFKKFFDENKRRYYAGNSKPEFYFGMWSEIILRTTDKPAELMTIYYENLDPIDYRFDDATRAAVVKKFFDKVGDTETLPSAYFQAQLTWVRLSQGRTKDALELAEPAYDKVEKISMRDDERPIKISVMITLADVLRRLNRYTDEIPLREKIVRECERCFPVKDNRIIVAKKALADALERGDKQNDALAIRRQIFESLDERDGEKFIDAAFTFAKALEKNKDYKSALPIRRKIVAFYENKRDDLLPLALDNLIDTLKHFSDEEHLKEQAECYRQYFELCEKIGWEISSDDIEDFAKILKELGLYDEAESILQKQADDSSRRIEDLKRRIEAVDNPDVETVKLMSDLVSALNEANKDSEAEQWRKKISTVAQTIIEQTCREPIEDYETAISTLNKLSHFFFGFNDLELWLYGFDKEKLNIKRAILALTEKKPDAKEAEIIEAKQKLLSELQGLFGWTEDYEEAKQLFDEIESYYRESYDRKNLPTSFEKLVDVLRDYANFLKDINEYSAAIEKLSEALDLLEKDSEPHVDEILRTMRDIANVFKDEKNYSEELIWRERILNFCREHFTEDAPKTLEMLDELVRFHERLEDYDRAEQRRNKLNTLKGKNLGDSHLDTIKAKEELADTIHDAEKFDEEINVRKQIVELWRENFSANAVNKEEHHSDFIWAMKKLAVCLDEQERKAEALEVCKQIVDEEKERVQWLEDNSADDVKIISAMDDLADVLHAIEDFAAATDLRKQIVDFWREKVSANPESKKENYSDFIETRLMLAISILKANQHDGATNERINALEQLNSLLEETIAEYGADSWYVGFLLISIDDARKKIKDDAQALKKFDELFGAYDLTQDDNAEEFSDIDEEISATEDDSPDETSPTEIDASDSLELRKGQRVPLAKDNSALDKLTVDFRWEGDADLEIDASAFLLGKDEKAHADEDFIFYGNEESGGVKYISGDGQATMQVALKNISDDVAKISFSLTIYDADERKQNFGGTKIFARIVDETTRKEILHFDLTDNFTIETAVIIGEIYRHKDAWKFNAIGAGFSGGLKALCKNFGLEVD